MSLKWRIALGMAAIAALVSIFGATAAYLNTQERLQSSLDESLLNKAHDIASAAPRRPGDGGRPGPGSGGFDDDTCPRVDFVQPATIAQFIEHPYARMISDLLVPGTLVYDIVYVGLIIFFCYFYTAVTFNPTDVADNMKKYGGYVPGIRPGQRTAEYIDRILTRLTLSGAIYASSVCILPTLLIRQVNVPFYFGGTALLIVVGVALDTVAQMETHLLTRNYEGFMKRGRIRGRRG